MGPKKNTFKNQTQPAYYKEATPYNESGNTDSWRRDENDDEGEYYTATPTLPPVRYHDVTLRFTVDYSRIITATREIS
jgi:hypothetical protein